MMPVKIMSALFIPFFVFVHCTTDTPKETKQNTAAHVPVLDYDTTVKTIHVLVALCDNKYQGIVPVPSKIGNGQDADNNLYWGCAFGVRTFFKNSSQWKLIRQTKGDNAVMERLVFKNKNSNYYLIADAYNGKLIKDCTIDFLNFCAGNKKDSLQLPGKTIGIGGNASLIAYIGHDGLMDFSIEEKFVNSDNKKRDAIMLACISKKYFASHLRETKADPLLWSTGLMSPEAYTLHDGLEAYINKNDVRMAAAKAYSKYQHCSVRAAQNLLVSGW